MMLRSGSSEGPTASGSPFSPTTTNEQVASKPILATDSGGMPECATAVLYTRRPPAKSGGWIVLPVSRAAKQGDFPRGMGKQLALKVEDAGAHAAGADIDANNGLGIVIHKAVLKPPG